MVEQIWKVKYIAKNEDILGVGLIEQNSSCPYISELPHSFARNFLLIQFRSPTKNSWIKCL